VAYAFPLFQYRSFFSQSNFTTRCNVTVVNLSGPSHTEEVFCEVIFLYGITGSWRWKNKCLFSYLYRLVPFTSIFFSFICFFLVLFLLFTPLFFLFFCMFPPLFSSFSYIGLIFYITILVLLLYRFPSPFSQSSPAQLYL
jgi:hypothetical protein